MPDLLPNGKKRDKEHKESKRKLLIDQLLPLLNETKAKVKKGQNAQALETLKKLKALLSRL